MERVQTQLPATPHGAALPVDRETGAWALSLVTHLAALVLLTLTAFQLPAPESLELLAKPDDAPLELTPQEFRFSDEPQDEVGALARAGELDAAAGAEVEAPEPEVLIPLAPLLEVGPIQAFETADVSLAGPLVDPERIATGVGGVGATGASGAVDRITQEILRSLDREPTLVVWLFDQSGSLAAQREEIIQRFDRVYDELGAIRDAGGDAFRSAAGPPLLTAVAQYGQKLELLTPEPTDRLDEVKQAAREVTEDPSGVENVFTAVAKLADKYRTLRLRSPRRAVMFVLFTDESGDDFTALDDAVERCQKLQMPVYVVGVPAPFGRRETYVTLRYKPDPRYEGDSVRVPLDQGPESLFPEAIRLGFLGDADPRDEPLDSGFGPYGLMRLTQQTGGIYFMVHPNRAVGRRIGEGEVTGVSGYLARFFDPRVMRRYRPRYVSVREHQAELARNNAKRALVEASQFSWTAPMDNVQRVFEKGDEASFAESLSRAQRSAAKLEPVLGRLAATLQAGQRDRDALDEPRWQAGYDLALGRALAAKVRAEGYNTMLAQAKQGMPFREPKSDTWVIGPSDTVSTGSTLAREAELARAALERVVADHPGTPWAHLAERELASPFGWEWREEFRDVAARRERMAQLAARPRPPRPEAPAPQRQARPVPKL